MVLLRALKVLKTSQRRPSWTSSVWKWNIYMDVWTDKFQYFKRNKNQSVLTPANKNKNDDHEKALPWFVRPSACETWGRSSGWTGSESWGGFGRCTCTQPGFERSWSTEINYSILNIWFTLFSENFSTKTTAMFLDTVEPAECDHG